MDYLEFQHSGFTSFDICSLKEIEALKELYTATQTEENRTGMYVSVNSGKSRVVKETSDKIYQILEKSLSSLLPEYRYFLGHFAVKSKHTAQGFDLHRDWNVVNEATHNSIGIWIPLSVSTPDNGGMCFIAKSHQFNNSPRSGSLGIPFIKIEEDIYPYLSQMCLSPGQAVAFYKNLFHGSFPNPTDEDRIAVLVNLVPKDSETEYVHWNEETQHIQVYSMTVDELVNSLPALEKGETPITQLKREYPTPAPLKKQTYIPKEELLEWIHNYQPVNNIKPRQNFIYADSGSIFSELQNNGYAVIKSAFDCQALQNNAFIAKKLQSASANTSFYYSLLNNDRETNMLLSSLIIEQFKQNLTSLFPNYRFLAGSFLTKQAEDYSELYLHQDWCNTDESQFSSITAWAPLIDTDENSGGMFFLKGSHTYFDNLRSYSYETARFPLTEIGNENITPVKIEKGDILLFNPAVWHGSFPNMLDSARSVFTCIILPENAPLYYFHKHSEEIAMRCDAPDNMLEYYLSDIVSGKYIDIYDADNRINYNSPKISAADLIKKHTSSLPI